MAGENFDNPWGRTMKNGTPLKIGAILDGAVFPGTQGGPLEHVIAGKAVAFGEALDTSFKVYGEQVVHNARAMAQAFMDKGYHIISGGTDNHLMLIDLRSKGVTGKAAEKGLEHADITVNKNMVPFDTQSPFTTSGIRIGTPALTTRGLVESDMNQISEWIDRVVTAPNDESVIQAVGNEVKARMSGLPLYVA